jgi:hypothetical protein
MDPAPSPQPTRPVTLPPPVHDDLRDFSDDVGSPAASAIHGEPTDLAAGATPDIEPPTLDTSVAGAVAMAEIEMPAIDVSGASDFAEPPPAIGDALAESGFGEDALVAEFGLGDEAGA